MKSASRIFAPSALTLALFAMNAWTQTPSVTPGTVPQSFDAVQTPASRETATPMPQVHQDRGVNYVSGGVSDGERAQLAQIARGFSLELEMAQINPAGAPNPYVANVSIAVTDTSGRPVLNARSDGPIFYAKLPPGRYRVSATTEDGRTASKVVQLTGRGTQKIGLRWSAEGPLG